MVSSGSAVSDFVAKGGCSMKRIVLVLAVLVASVPCFAQAGFNLETAFASLRRSIAPALTAQKASATRAAASVRAVTPKVREFYIRYRNGSWGDGHGGYRWPLSISVVEGDHVLLHLEDWSWADGRDPFPSRDVVFEVDGLEAVVDGQPSKNIRVWLRGGSDRAEVEFDAVKPGYYRIYEGASRFRDIGEIRIAKKK
jgi:hypothetical protein